MGGVGLFWGLVRRVLLGVLGDLETYVHVGS